jgi:uncharacterized protein YndB with AHSA1/START domain
MPSTLKIHRVIKAPPERVFKAFTNAAAMSKWLSPNGFTCTVLHMDVKVGGTFKMSFASLESGAGHSFHGEYLEIKPFEKLVYTDQFDDPNLPGVLTVTVLLKAVMCGTELNVTQEGIPDAIPLEMCYLGWQDSMRQLMELVETAAP